MSAMFHSSFLQPLWTDRRGVEKGSCAGGKPPTSASQVMGEKREADAAYADMEEEQQCASKAW